MATARTPRTRKATGETVTVSMYVAKETVGTKQFKEVDADGEFLEGRDAQIGTLYVPKRTLKTMGDPDSISVTVTA